MYLYREYFTAKYLLFGYMDPYTLKPFLNPERSVPLKGTLFGYMDLYTLNLYRYP